jgi:hypothetical protein
MRRRPLTLPAVTAYLNARLKRRWPRLGPDKKSPAGWGRSFLERTKTVRCFSGMQHVALTLTAKP